MSDSAPHVRHGGFRILCCCDDGCFVFLVRTGTGGACCHRSHGVVPAASRLFFFFSSRRRHTRCSRDWRDVCSSDLRRRGRISPAGLSCCVSSWTRTSDNAIPIRLKCGPNYQNGRLALLQAKADGYDAPILLNAQGHVAEGTGATFFMVRKGRLVTPPVTADILESITRATLIEEICPNVLGLPVVEREIDRTELYVADEAFFCGSGYEITPIVSIDRFPLGDGEVGVLTRRMLRAYMDVVRGIDKRYSEWRTATYRGVTV